jgi:hypothetical protein
MNQAERNLLAVSVRDAVAIAKEDAYQAAAKFFQEKLGGRDQYACGFAWVTVYEKGSTKLGRELIKNGFRKSYRGGLEMWNPSEFGCQNVDTLEAGAEAAARVLTERLGVKAYAGSRLD